MACFEVCLEKVLSNTNPYMPPLPAWTSNVPMDTLSASHFPHHFIDINPLLASNSCAVVSFFANRLVLPSVTPCACSASGSIESPVDETRLVAPLPGCLTIPKFLREVRPVSFGGLKDEVRYSLDVHGLLVWLNAP